MSKRKADELISNTNPEETTEQVPVRSRRAVRRVATTTTPPANIIQQNKTEEEIQTPAAKITKIVTSEVPSVITIVKEGTLNEEFSKKEKETLDESFGKFMFTLCTYYHRGFSDFKLSAINELYNGNGELISFETLKMIQYIVPELFTIYLNQNQEICVNVCNDFEKVKSSIVGLWKKRLATIEKPQSLDSQVEVRSLTIPIKKSLPKIENSTNKTEKQPKKSIEEMLKENDKREQEELERAKILSKKFENDRVVETLLIMFT